MGKFESIIVGVANHKGGIGKTITVQNLGCALALLLAPKKEDVLLIDFDPQCNLSRHCGIDENSEVKTISNYLNDAEGILPIEPVRVEDYENLYLIPSSEDLDQDSINMGSMDDEDYACRLLIEIINKVKTKYSFIIIDSAPGSGMLMLNMVFASDKIIIPIADKDSLYGINKINKIVEYNRLDVDIKFLQTKYDSRESAFQEIKDLLIEDSDDRLYHTYIRKNSELNKAANNSKDIFSYNPKCNGARDYQSLAKELLRDIKKKK